MVSFVEAVKIANSPEYKPQYRGCDVLDKVNTCTYVPVMDAPIGQPGLKGFIPMGVTLVLAFVIVYAMAVDVFTKRLVLSGVFALAVLLAANTIYSYVVFTEGLENGSIPYPVSYSSGSGRN